MKIRIINMSKYKMGKMPLRFYLPRIKRYWSNQIWQFMILRDYGIEFDFRKGDIISQLMHPKTKRNGKNKAN